MAGHAKYEKEDLEAPAPKAQEELQPAELTNQDAKTDSADAASGSTVTQSPNTESLPYTTKSGLPNQENGLVSATYWDIFRRWFFLGWTAFGGPSAHLAIFQKIFVEKLRWISNTIFLELLALSQCLPGPSSTQVSFALGVVKKGATGGLISGALFQYPGLLIMSLVGVGAANFLKNPEPWLQGILAGLGAAGVALVAGSAVALTYSTCKDRVTMAINGVSSVVAYYYASAWIFPTLIVLGGLVTLYTKRKEDLSVKNADEHVEKFGVSKVWGAALVTLWVAILVVCICLAHYLPDLNVLSWWAVFFRTGSLIFGGGQVVLPMMYNAIVQQDCKFLNGREICVDSPDTWMSTSDFYTGLAIVQAMPGPLFSLAAYQGAIIAHNAGIFPLVGILVCWIGLFAPGILLIYGILPWWALFRHFKIYRRMLPGLNSADGSPRYKDFADV